MGAKPLNKETPAARENDRQTETDRQIFLRSSIKPEAQICSL